MSTNDKAWIETAAELADVCSCSRTAVYDKAKRPGFPAKTKRGWPRADVLKFVRDEAARSAARAAGSAGKEALECDLIERRIALLDEQIAQAEIATQRERGQVVTVDEVKATLAEIAGQVLRVFDLWISEVRMTSADPELVSKAEELRDAARRRLVAECHSNEG